MAATEWISAMFRAGIPEPTGGVEGPPILFGNEAGPQASFFSPWHTYNFAEHWTVQYVSLGQMILVLKADLFGDTETKARLLATKDTEQHKLLGRSIKNVDNSIWEKERYKIAIRVYYAKFSYTLLGSSNIQEILRRTGRRELIYASPNDEWGFGLDSVNATNVDRENLGENLFGKAAMLAREKLRWCFEEDAIAKYDDPKSPYYIEW